MILNTLPGFSSSYSLTILCPSGQNPQLIPVYSSIITFLFAGSVETNWGVCAPTAKAANNPKYDKYLTRVRNAANIVQHANSPQNRKLGSLNV